MYLDAGWFKCGTKFGPEKLPFPQASQALKNETLYCMRWPLQFKRSSSIEAPRDHTLLHAPWRAWHDQPSIMLTCSVVSDPAFSSWFKKIIPWHSSYGKIWSSHGNPVLSSQPGHQDLYHFCGQKSTLVLREPSLVSSSRSYLRSDIIIDQGKTKGEEGEGKKET